MTTNTQKTCYCEEIKDVCSFCEDKYDCGNLPFDDEGESQ